MADDEARIAAPPQRVRARKKASSHGTVAGEKRRKLPARKSRKVTPDYVHIDEAMLRLVFEAAEARIRHRALLETIRDGKPMDWERYLVIFDEISARDRKAFIDSLIMTRDAFDALHHDWLLDDLAIYGTRYSRQHAIETRKAERDDSTDQKDQIE